MSIRNKKVSAKQQQIYDFIVEFTSAHGYPPSVREICAAVDLKSPSTVHSHLKTLSTLGYIDKDDRKTRALSVSKPADSANSVEQTVVVPETTQQIPLVGRVAAGSPILAVQEVEDYITFDLGSASGVFFALRVRGDSMINAGIFNGDVIIVRSQSDAEHGEIVVGMIGEEATVKRLFKQNGKIMLMPENPAYSPIDGDEAVILGKVYAVIRRYA